MTAGHGAGKGPFSGHHITQQSSTREKLSLGSTQRDTLAWKTNDVPTMGVGEAAAGSAQAVDWTRREQGEERGGRTDTAADGLALGAPEASLGNPGNHQGILRGSKCCQPSRWLVPTQFVFPG